MGHDRTEVYVSDSLSVAPAAIVDPGMFDPTPWDPELVEQLHELLARIDGGGEALGEGIEELRTRYGNLVYAELIYLLSHLRFEPGEALRVWEKVGGHREQMQERLGTPIDLRVALISYFLEVNRKLRSPKIIEMHLYERTRESAYRDELTGLHNYRLFREYLAQELARSERAGTPMSLVMLDVDNFKTYNDCNGHEVGNDTLTVIAQLLKTMLRKADVAARYGGEEFVIILPQTPKTEAHEVAERAREAIEHHSFPNEQGLPGGKLTVSVGVATYPADAAEATDLVRRADRAMYVAKACGKNQVRLYARSRRSFGRVEAVIPGSFNVISPDPSTLKTLNVSEAGMLFQHGAPFDTGTLIEVQLDLPGREHDVCGAARVVHSEPVENGRYKIAVRFTEMADADRLALVEYTREIGERERENEND